MTQPAPHESDLLSEIGTQERWALVAGRAGWLKQLTGLSGAELLRMQSIGPKAVERLRSAFGA